MLVLLVTFIWQSETQEEPLLFSAFYLAALIDSLIQVVYLSWPWLARKLKSCYLPIALALTSIGPIIEDQLFVQPVMRHFRPPPPSWQLISILFVPLVICAWQYSFRKVALYTLLISLVDLGLSYWNLQFAERPMPLFVMASMILTRAAIFLIVGYMVTNMMSRQRTQRAELQKANEQLLNYANASEQLAVSRERNRLARELHDVLAHTLSGVAVELEAVKALWDIEPAKARHMLEEAQQSTLSGLTDARRSLQALRASPLEDLGLVLALRSLAETEATRSNLKLDVHLPPSGLQLPAAMEQCIYRITQEALTNIAKHASATRITLELSVERDTIRLHIADDGLGFDPASVDGNKFGLKGMEERAHLSGAKLNIQSAPGEGTHIWLVYGD